MTVTIQEVILDRFCHSNPVPTKNVVFPPCWKIIKIFSLLACTVRHTVGAVVPGREIQVIYMHLNFSSRYAMSITYDCEFGDQLLYSYCTTGILDFEIMIYLINQMYQYGDQLWCGKSWSIWSTICMNMRTFFKYGPTKGIWRNWNQNWGFDDGNWFTGTIYHSLTNRKLVFFDAVWIFDIAKEYASRSNVIACIFFCVSFFPCIFVGDIYWHNYIKWTTTGTTFSMGMTNLMF